MTFRLFGVPVSIHPTFLVVMLLFGISLPRFDAIAVWVVVATVAVLLHELGHALVARRFGHEPSITLAGLGGLTTWHRGSEVGRWRLLAVSLAGPGAGMLGGVAAVLLGGGLESPSMRTGLSGFALEAWIFASFGWSILNLLPVLPLDGGHALEQLLPGEPMVRRRRAHAVSIAVGGVAALWALTTGWTYAALLVGFMVYSNVQGLLHVREASGPAADGVRQAVAQYESGDTAGAARTAAAIVGEPGPQRIRAAALSVLIHALVARGDLDEAYRTIADPRLDVAAEEPAYARLQAAARQRGDQRAAAGVGDRALHAGVRSPVLAYNTACAYAALGDLDAAATRLSWALDLGFDDLDVLRDDPDLRPLQSHPQWPALARGEVHAPFRTTGHDLR